jgi:hypothetical protein
VHSTAHWGRVRVAETRREDADESGGSGAGDSSEVYYEYDSVGNVVRKAVRLETGEWQVVLTD